jgi:hypothetical protein
MPVEGGVDKAGLSGEGRVGGHEYVGELTERLLKPNILARSLVHAASST